jgi:hypothetical protein
MQRLAVDGDLIARGLRGADRGANWSEGVDAFARSLTDPGVSGSAPAGDAVNGDTADFESSGRERHPSRRPTPSTSSSIRSTNLFSTAAQSADTAARACECRHGDEHFPGVTASSAVLIRLARPMVPAPSEGARSAVPSRSWETSCPGADGGEPSPK